MYLFLKILLFFDLLILLVMLYETFLVSSNRSMTGINLTLITCMGLAWWFRFSYPKLALVLAGLPVGVVLFLFLMLVFASGGKWQ